MNKFAYLALIGASSAIIANNTVVNNTQLANVAVNVTSLTQTTKVMQEKVPIKGSEPT